ncbi:MAG: hypothetical protein Q7S50_02470 [bacterium]|nr:hypothetical protein [bacterium]
MGLDDETKLGQEKSESLKGMAARYGDEVYTGILHSDAVKEFRAAHPEHAEKSEQEVGLEVGYVTNTGRFVGREEAVMIGHRADQLKKGIAQRRSKLLGSDLKDGWDKDKDSE